MYLPAQFKPASQDEAFALMRAHPLATLISLDDQGSPFVTHLPLHRQEGAGPTVLLGHVAKANPHWRYLQSRAEALALFMGPQAFMSTRVYPDLARVPTWNYLAVHCKVRAQLVEDEEGKDSILKSLIADHDPPYAEQWRALPDDFRRKMLAGIVAFKLEVHGLQCKLKLNQHRPEAHAAMRSGYAQGNEQERALGDWMDRLGLSSKA